MKKLLSILAVAPIVLTACGSKDAAIKDVSILAPNGAPATAVVSMAANDYKGNVDFIDGSAPLIAGFAAGDHDAIFAGVHFGTTGNVVGKGYQLAAITSFGVDHIVSTDPNITTIADVVTAGNAMTGYGNCIFYKGATGNAPTCTSLASTNLVAAQLTLDIAASIEGVYLVAEPSLSAVTLPEDATVIDLSKVWAEENDDSNGYPQAGVYLHEDFIKDQEEAALELLTDIEASIGVYKNEHDRFVREAGEVNYAYDNRAEGKINIGFMKASEMTDEIDAWTTATTGTTFADDAIWAY